MMITDGSYKENIAKFEDIYAKCRKTFDKYEVIRIITLCVLTVVYFFISWGIFDCFMTIENVQPRYYKYLWFVVFGMFLLWYFVKKLIEYFIKDDVMTKFMDAFGTLEWSLEDILTYEQVDKTKIFPTCMKNSYVTEDNIIGTYNGENLMLTKLKLYINLGFFFTKAIFNGVALTLNLKKNINGEILVVPRGFVPITRLEKVHLEDKKWQKLFDVYASDQVEARYFLTAGLMDRIKHLKKTYNAKNVRISVKENIMILGLDMRKDAFDVCKMFHPINDKEIWKILYFQIYSILELSNMFNKTVL